MYYLYQFIDENDTIIYIGITGDIKTRINAQHFGSTGHLPEECYKKARMVLYCQCISRDDAKIRERYFINEVSPKYNSKMKNNSRFSFKIPDIEWKYLPLDKSKITKRKKPSRVVRLNNISVAYKKKYYKSLCSGGLQLLNKINSECVVLRQKKRGGDTLEVCALSFNDNVWLFSDEICNWVGALRAMSSTVNTIKLINNSIINASDVCISTDPVLNKSTRPARLVCGMGENDMYVEEYWEEYTPSQSTKVLLSVGAIKKLLNYIVSTMKSKYTQGLDRRGYIRYKSVRIHSISDFIDV
jgi:predicted GIY-YIG superfamily endonuclease